MKVVQVEELKELKRRNGYTYKKMEEIIGYKRSYINSILNGKLPVTHAFSAKVAQAFPLISKNGNRASVVNRETRETNISLELNIDSNGKNEINTGITMFDHMLAQVTQHGRFGITLSATGDDPHHLVEDVAICMGKALNKALGEKRGIIRMGDATVSMDDALAMVAVDIGGRGYTVLELPFTDNDMAGFPTDLVRHFLESFAAEAKLNLHARILYGVNDHHKAEALFKALGRALDMATRIDERISGELPSTKEFLES
jgi:imidazoleglycerol-phosphate dehydratase